MAKTKTADSVAIPARQGEPGQRWTYHDRADGEIDLVADDTGRVEIETPEQDRLATRLGIPVAEGAES